MLEMLLILACVNGTSQSCMTSGDAWQKYYGYDKIIEDYGQKNPIIAQTVSSIGLFHTKRLYYQISGPWYHEINAADGFKTIAYWKKEF